jgi:pantoate kinase
MKGIAFAPGHVSAFFEPRYYVGDLDRTGSRGAGISMSLGAISRASVSPATDLLITVCINGKSASAPVTKLAVKNLVGETSIHINIDTILDLPESQGFGMSAAGALSAALATADILSLPRDLAVKAAHRAEVQSRTGLGDVIASNFGGIEIRRQAGLPPWGMLEHIPGKFSLVLCVVGRKLQTKRILTDTEKLVKIASYGRYCTKKLLERPTAEQLFYLGWEFTKKTGLAERQVIRAIEAANQYGMASMCQLGNSVFAAGDTRMLHKTLLSYGSVCVCDIDQCGARLLEKE